MRLVDAAKCELSLDLAQHVLEEQGFADPRRPHEEYDPGTALQRGKHFASCAQVFLARIQKIRIRAKAKRQLVEAKKLRVHVLSLRSRSARRMSPRVLHALSR